MTFRKSLIAACAVSVLGFGTSAIAQTAAPATPDATAPAMAAPDTADKPMAKPMKPMKHMKKKKMMKKM